MPDKPKNGRPKGPAKPGTRAFAIALAAARLKLDLSQNDLGRLLDGARPWGNCNSYVAQLERGERNPSLDGAARIARALGLPSWHFDQALFHEALESQCKQSEMTRVIVGLQTFALSMDAESWAALRGGK